MAFTPSLFCLSRGLKLSLRVFKKKYRFLMQNTGFGVSEYSFVIPEVGMSGLPPVGGPLVNYEMV
jgi:hypothetical protein